MVPGVYGVKIWMGKGNLWNGYQDEERKYLPCPIQKMLNDNRYFSV